MPSKQVVTSVILHNSICMYNWAYTAIYLLMYTDVYVQYIHTYTVSIRQSTYHIQFCCIWYVHDRICIYMYVYVFLWAVFYLDCSSICMYIQFIHAYTDTVMGGTYVSICKYMYVFLSKIHAYTSSSIWTYFQQYIWQYICLYFQQYFLLYFSCTYTRPRCRHGCFAFAGACARSLPLRRAVAMASLSRGSASAGRLPHSIRSGLRGWTLNSGSQRRLVQARPCRSAMAILVGSRSRGNRGAATSQWHWNDEKFIESTTTAEKAILGFLEPTAHRNPSTEKQRKRLKNY